MRIAIPELSSDRFRALVSDDELDQTATRDAFEVLHHLATKRLARGRLTVIDATNTRPTARKPLVELARDAYLQPVALVFDLPARVCEERNRGRGDRQVPPHAVFQQRSQLERSLRGLQKEGFRRVFILRSPEEVEAVTIERERAAEAGRAARPGGRYWRQNGQADRPDPAARRRDDPGGERDRGPGGHEPLRRGPALAQPALKCRGREYLRIIYGPEYTLPENLQRLRSRGLAAKWSLAIRELALGVEALERFVAREPLRRVQECVFGILALESEPVDPRL